MPLLPQDVDPGVDALQTHPGPCPPATPNVQASEAASTIKSVPPSKSCTTLATQRNSFGLFRIYDVESIPNANDPEDQSGAGPLPARGLNVPTSQTLSGSVNSFHPYPNESSWLIGD